MVIYSWSLEIRNVCITVCRKCIHFCYYSVLFVCKSLWKSILFAYWWACLFYYLFDVTRICHVLTVPLQFVFLHFCIFMYFKINIGSDSSYNFVYKWHRDICKTGKLVLLNNISFSIQGCLDQSTHLFFSQ